MSVNFMGRNIVKRLKKLYRCKRKAMEAWGVFSNELGWTRSFLEGRPVDAQGEAIPWYTYPAIEYLRSLDFSGKKVFEFGCGNSSVFWASRVEEVYAVENNIEWASIVRSMAIPNLTLIEEENRDLYITAPDNLDIKFDVVVIDGRYRRQCVASACRSVLGDGIIIFDNSDWYPDACKDIREKGWLQIDFTGLGPIAPFPWTTSLFLKSSAKLKKKEDHKIIGGSVPVWNSDD